MTDTVLKELLSVPDLSGLPHLALLHYLLSRTKGGKHVAHCLDLDLVTVGTSQKSAAAKLDALVKAHIELALATGQLSNLLTRAPQEFWSRFADGTPVQLEPTRIVIDIPESVQIVPLSESEIRILAHAA